MANFFKSLMCCCFLVFSCSSPEIDYNELNKLIAARHYNQAILKIEEYRNYINNQLELQKLNQLYIFADKALLFNNLKRKLLLRDTLDVRTEMNVIFKQIQAKDSLTQRWYYFDYYLSQGEFCLISGDSSKRVSNLLKAVQYPVKNIQKKITVFLDLSFHYAEEKHFEKAREWLDKAMRSFEKNEHKGKLLDVYMAYMNGDYIKADSILAMVPQENKNLNWQRVESFFNLYLHSLSLKDRFRLW